MFCFINEFPDNMHLRRLEKRHFAPAIFERMLVSNFCCNSFKFSTMALTFDTQQAERLNIIDKNFIEFQYNV